MGDEPKKVIIKSKFKFEKVEIKKEQFDTIRRNVKGAMDIVNELHSAMFRESAECKNCFDLHGMIIGCRCKNKEKS